VATTWHQKSNYVGLQADARFDAGPNNFSGGVYTFHQTESDLFGLVINDQSYAANSVPNTTANSSAELAESIFQITCTWTEHHLAGRNAGFVLPRRVC